MSGHQCLKITIGHSMNVSGFIFSISGPSGSSGGADAAVIHHAEGNAEASFCNPKVGYRAQNCDISVVLHTHSEETGFIPPIFQPKCAFKHVGDPLITAWAGPFFFKQKTGARSGAAAATQS
jgi:hypothetical protein